MEFGSYIQYLRDDKIKLGDLIHEWNTETTENPYDILELVYELLVAHSNCPIKMFENEFSCEPLPLKRSSNQQANNISSPGLSLISHYGKRSLADTTETLTSVRKINDHGDNPHERKCSKEVEQFASTGCGLSDIKRVVTKRESIEFVENLILSRKKMVQIFDEMRIPIPGILLSPSPFPPSLKKKSSSTMNSRDNAEVDANSDSSTYCRRKGDLRVIPVPPAPGRRWEDVTITFISHDSVRIEAGDLDKRLHFAEMGFKDGRKGDIPDTRWAILREFAARNGTISWSDINVKHSDKMKSAIKDIRKRLKAVLGVAEDPFYPYRQVKAYKTRFTLRDVTVNANQDQGPIERLHG